MVNSYWSVWAYVLVGLALFIISINRLSVLLRGAFSDKLKQQINGSTDGLFRSIAVGLVGTMLLNSSSATIIIAIIFINSGALNFRNAMGIILGSNVGTTFSSQIYAFNPGQWSFIPIVIGLGILMFANTHKLKIIGKVTMYFGALFLGMYVMQQSVRPLQDNQVFTDWLLTIGEHRVTGAVIGGMITLIIQSSSATVAMAIALAHEHFMTLPAGIAVMLGAELGTCSDTLIATIRGKKPAIFAGVFHLLFNLVFITLGLLLFPYLVDLVRWISPPENIGRQIANGHVLFNVLAVLLFLPFAGKVADVIEGWLNVADDHR